MLTVSPRQALLQAGDLDSCCEPAGSEAAKFRLWVKSKGLSLTRPGAGAGASSLTEEGQEGDRGDSPVLYVPTGTDKVSPTSCCGDKYVIMYQLPTLLDRLDTGYGICSYWFLRNWKAILVN